ncbi:MAG: helix-turn-helix transcriptional regulator [Sedimentisphaerales bacterium]|nr:helix-turn-helix transcriptional regulator [Sedimentisphaerales bacterium]
MRKTKQSVALSGPPKRGKVPLRLVPAIEFIQANYDLMLRLADMAYETEFSVGRFCHLFKEHLGITPMQYVTQVRIEHAKRLLRTSRMNNEAIGDLVGYRRESYFIRMFKRTTGTTPQAYRQAHRKKHGKRKR